MSKTTTAVFSMSSKKYQPLADITYPKWNRYCESHGYHFIAEPGAVTDSMPWDKVEGIRQLLKRYEQVMWVGADTLPTRMDWDIEVYGGVKCCYDIYGINSDVMMFARRADKLLYAVGTIGRSLYEDHPWIEQEAFIRFSSHPEYSSLYSYMDQSEMNAYLNEEYGRPASWGGQWTQESKVIHFPGLPLERRVELAKIYSKYCDR